MSLSFFVPGIPVAQGSKRAFVVKGKPVLVESAKGLGEWRSRVALAARQAVRASGGDWWSRKEPLLLTAKFVFPRPASLPKNRKEHVVRPDLSKILRAIEDSMTGIVFGDDAQLISIWAYKLYAGHGEAPGVEIEIRDGREVAEK